MRGRRRGGTRGRRSGETRSGTDCLHHTPDARLCRSTMQQQRQQQGRWQFDSRTVRSTGHCVSQDRPCLVTPCLWYLYTMGYLSPVLLTASEYNSQCQGRAQCTWKKLYRLLLFITAHEQKQHSIDYR